MKNIIVFYLMLVMTCGLIFSAVSQPVLVAVASDAPFVEQMKVNLTTVGGAGYDVTEKPIPLTMIIGNVIKVVLAFLGVIVIVLVIYAGFMWMTAGGDPEQVKKAKDWLTNAVIGLAIILAAYAITEFVIGSLFTATTGEDYPV